MIIKHKRFSTFVSTGGTQWEKGLDTLVLLHGAGLNRTVWVLLGRYFARRGFNVIIPDLPGHGASNGKALTSIEDYADWVNSLVAALSKDKALSDKNIAYAGHSMGSLVMLEAAARNTKHVNRLVLLGSAAPMSVGDALLNAAKNNEHAAIEMINMFGHAFGSRIGNNPISGINVYNSMEALLEQADDGVLYNDLNACNEYQNGEAAAKSIAGKIESTIISGTEDKMTPVKACKQLTEWLDGSMLLLDDCGHMMMSEKPEASLQAMKKALNV